MLGLAITLGTALRLGGSIYQPESGSLEEVNRDIVIELGIFRCRVNALVDCFESNLSLTDMSV